MPSTTQFEIDELSPQARDIYHQTLRNFDDSYGLPPQDHHCFGPKEHHTRYNFEDAERFQAYTKALDLRFEEPDSQGGTRGTVRTAPEVDTVQGHYGIYRIVDQVHNARIAQACHPGLRGMEFIEIDISDELYFGDLLAVKTLAFNPGYFPRPSGSSVLPYHRTTATLPGDHCRWSAREYLVFRRDIRTSQMLLRVDERVGVIEGYSGLTRLPSSFHKGRVYLGDVFYPEHLNIRGLTPILTHLPTILRHWKSRCAVPESLRALADSADLQNTRFDHRMFQHRVKICRDGELTVNCSADWLEGSRVLVGFLDREIEAVLVKSCNGDLTFQLLERYTGPPWVPVMVQQLGFQGEPFRERPLSREGFEEYRGDLGNRGDRGDREDRGYRGRSRRSSGGSEEYRGDQGAPFRERPQSREGFEDYRGDQRSPSEDRYPQQLVGVYDPEPNRGSPVFEKKYGRDEGQRSIRDQWDSPERQDSSDSRQGYRPSSPEHRYWSPGPRQSSQWDRNDLPRQWDHFNQPQESFTSQGAQFRQARESFGSQDAQFRRPESEQYQNDPQQPSEYRSQHQQFSESQFSPQGAQFYCSQPENRPNDSQYPSSQSGYPQDRSLYHNPLEGRYNDSPCSSDQQSLTREQLIAQNYQNYQRERGQSYAEDPQYPSEQPGHPSSQYGNQNGRSYCNQAEERRSQPNDAQYPSEYRNQGQDCPDNNSRYPTDRPGSPNPGQFCRSQPGDRPNASQYPSNPQYPSEYRSQPSENFNSQFSSQQRHSYHSDYPVIQTEQSNHRQDPQTDQGYRNQSDDRPFNASGYPSDHQGLFQPQHGPQSAHGYRNQSDEHRSYANDGQYPSGYRSQPDNRYSSHNEPWYPSNQRGHPLETPILCQNRLPYRSQPGDPQYDSQYPSEYCGQPQDYFKPQFSPQQNRNGQPDRNQSFGRPANAPQYPPGQPGPSNPQYGSQYPRNQSEDRQTLPRSLSPRVSTLSPSGDPIIRHSQSRSSISQASSVSGDHFQGEQPSQSAPRASYPPSGSGGQGYASPAGYPVRNPLSYHSNQPQGHQPSPNQVPSTSRAAGYSDGLSPTGQSYYQGYATSSDGSEEDDSSSESEPEAPQRVQKQGYNALYSHFPSSFGQKVTDRYSPRVPSEVDGHQGAQPSPSIPRESGQPAPISTLKPVEPVEPPEPPKPARAVTPPFDPHNSRSWRHEHKDDICEVLEPKEPVCQDQRGPRGSQQPSQPVREGAEPSGLSNRISGDHGGSRVFHGPSQPVREHWDSEPTQSKSGSRFSADYRTAKASSHLRQPVRDHLDPEPGQSNSGSRSSADYRGSQASRHPRHPVKECHEPSGPGSRFSTDYGGSQTIYRLCHPIEDVWGPESINPTNRKASTASHYSADPKWPSEPENSAPEEDQHPENHTYNALISESSSPTVDTAQDHPYLPALLKHQVLVVDALNPELLIASAAASLAKTDWSLKTRGLKQRGTQVIVCKATEASRITGMLLDALDASGIRMVRFADEHLLQIDFERCLARKLRGILREPGAWDQRIVLQAARYLTRDPLTPKLENLLRNNSHIPEMPMEEWVAWYMERWVPDVLLSTSEYLEVGTKYLRRVESVQVLGEVSEDHGGLTARFPKAKIAVIGDVLGEAGGNLNPETVEILKESFSGLHGSQLISLRSKAPFPRPTGPNYLKIRSGIFPNLNFPILLIHNTSTKGTKEQRNLQERKALDQLVEGLLGLETDQTIPPEDLQIICIEKNQLRDLSSISTSGIRIRSRQEASEGVQGAYTRLEGSPSPRAPEEDDSAPQDHPQTTPIAIICCSNYKKTAFELIRGQLPQLLSYGTHATIFIGNIDEMEEAEGWRALVTRCDEVGCSYSYQMVPEERSRRYQPTKRDHKGFMGPLPEYGSSRGSSLEFGGFQSPKCGSSGSGSPRSVTRGSENLISGSGESSESPRSEPEEAEPKESEPKASEPSKPELEVREPKPEEPELPEPRPEESELPEPESEKPEPLEQEPKACEPKPEESEVTEVEPEEPEPLETEQVACEPKPEEPEPSEPKNKEPEPFEPEPEESEPSEPESKKPEPSESKPKEPEPCGPWPRACEPNPEDPEPLEPKHKVSEPKSEKPEPSEPEFEACEPKSEESEPSRPEPDASDPKSPISTLEHLDLAITATVSPTLSPAIPRKSCSQTPEKDFTTPDCLLETLTLEDLEPSDQEYEDCEEEFQDAQGDGNQDSDTETYESTFSDHQGTTELSTVEEALTGPEESESHEKLEEKQ